jgi:hypothetical protein
VQIGSFGEASKLVTLKGDDLKNIGGNLLHIYTHVLFSRMATHQVIDSLVHCMFIADRLTDQPPQCICEKRKLHITGAM